MYVRTRKELNNLLEERSLNEEDIRKKIDFWAEKEYGIKNFLAIRKKHMPFLSDKKNVYGFLARQIPSICVEDITCFIGSQKIGLEPVAMSFVQDNFSSANSEKLNRVKIPWSQINKNGNLNIRYKNVSSKSIPEIESHVLNCVPVVSGGTLPNFHNDLRRKVFGESYLTADISGFWSECLEKSENKPSFVYDTSSAKARKVFLSKKDFLAMNEKDFFNMRPPASWYYPLYFSCFLDGRMVLLETYENPNGEVPEAKKMFIQTMEAVKSISGCYPLILEIPPLLLEMRYLNEDILKNGTSWMEEISEEISFNNFSEDDNLCLFFKEISKKVIGYRK